MTGLQVAGVGHGKLVLCGEHAVVHGHPAIAFAVDLSTTVRLTARPGFTRIHSPHADQRLLEALSRVVPDEGLEIEIETDLPVGRGMGSSAALAVALVRARAVLDGEPLDPDRVYERAMPIERSFHGNPSGVDVAVSARGGCLWFRRGDPAQLARSRPAELDRSSASRPADFDRSSASRPADLDRSSASRPAELDGSSASGPADLDRSSGSRPADPDRSSASRPAGLDRSAVDRAAAESSGSPAGARDRSSTSGPADDRSAASGPADLAGSSASRPADPDRSSALRPVGPAEPSPASDADGSSTPRGADRALASGAGADRSSTPRPADPAESSASGQWSFGSQPLREPLEPGRWSIVVLDSGVAGDTAQLVAQVCARRPEIDPLLDRIGALVHEARSVLQDPPALGALLTENHRLLAQIGVSTPTLDELVELALGAGAYGAKLAGAGGGGVVLALCPETGPVLRAARARGIPAFETRPWTP